MYMMYKIQPKKMAMSDCLTHHCWNTHICQVVGC